MFLNTSPFSTEASVISNKVSFRRFGIIDLDSMRFNEIVQQLREQSDLFT